MSNSEEEEIARDYICFGNPDVTVVILDATCLERNLNLVYQTMEITNNIIVCVNLLDEAKKKGISIDLSLLSNLLGVPVVGTTARKPKTLKKLLDTIYQLCLHNLTSCPKKIAYSPALEDSIRLISSELCKIPSIPEILYRFISLKLLDGEQVILSSLEKHLEIHFGDYIELTTKVEEARCLLRKSDILESNFRDKVVSSILYSAEDVTNKVCHFENRDYASRDRKIDKIITSKKFGIPIMIAFLGIIFWITIVGANYPSQWLSHFFGFLQEKLVLVFDYFHAPAWLKGILIDGMYQTLSWVVSVMLPPMAIFFPLFTIMEDLGYLPRIAFNLDNFFKKACTTGKQALTMCMGVTKWDIF